MLYWSSRFRKQFKRCSPNIRQVAYDRLAALEQNEFEKFLNNHKLSGKCAQYRSINVTGDIRIMYQKVSNNSFYLAGIGTHSELYK